MKLSEPNELERFQIGNLLGEGADLQVFEAMDIESGAPVVIKRPHPTLISRNIHGNIEDRSLLQAELRDRIENPTALVQLHLMTEPGQFVWYFGDDPGHPYSVQVEERATGMPLVGGVTDMVRGYPVALPLNLFVLYPPKEYRGRELTNPALTTLDVIERIYEEGYLAQDLGPQNVFYSPGSAKYSVIDLGTLRKPSMATSRHPPLDLNDIIFHIFISYTTPEPPPRDPAGFVQAKETRLSGTLEKKTEAYSKKYAVLGSERAEAALRILYNLGRRAYVSPAQFREEFQDYLLAVKSVERDCATVEAWREAINGLKLPYWKKYLFDAETELN